MLRRAAISSAAVLRSSAASFLRPSTYARRASATSKARLVLMPRAVRWALTAGCLRTLSSSSKRSASTAPASSLSLIDRGSSVLLRLAHVSNCAHGFDDALSIVGFEGKETNAHARVQVLTERPHGIDPLHDAAEHECFLVAGWRKTEDELGTDGERFLRLHEDPHL